MRITVFYLALISVIIPVYNIKMNYLETALIVWFILLFNTRKSLENEEVTT